MDSAPVPQDLRGPKVEHQLVVGSRSQHLVEVSYGQRLRLFRVRIDGRTAYRHWGLLPWAGRQARDFKTPGREAHTLLVEPPGAAMNRDAAPGAYVIWLDGQPLVRIERAPGWFVRGTSRHAEA